MNLNDEQSLKELRKSFYSKDGQAVFEFINQQLNGEFDFNNISTTDEDRIVGENFKISMRVRKVMNKMLAVMDIKKPEKESLDY